MSYREHLRLFAHIGALPATAAAEETLIGGQAVLEGVMMRAPHSYCVAVRMPAGGMVTDERPLPRLSEKYPAFRYPILRGIGTLGHAMAIGIRALQFSAKAVIEDSQPDEAKKAIPGWVMGVNLAISLVFFLFLYKFVPLYLATVLGKPFPALKGRILFNLTDGVIRMTIFVSFLYLLSLWKDMRRLFEYHGAEHRVVFNYESGKPVTVENAQSFSTFHPRCGTSFLLVVMLVSIAVYTLLPFDSFVLKLAGRIVLLPLIVGLSYEAIRYAGKHRRGLMATLTTPGLWLQRITTKPPHDDQTAVAIRALEGAMALEQEQGGPLVVA
ncbi:MAG TPA: DUF1385 domain-containing protein [Bryobacteraceae bacterium]|nr:DUF1385 domain-containing protein [Bryobacteraceae bacterium]